MLQSPGGMSVNKATGEGSTTASTPTADPPTAGQRPGLARRWFNNLVELVVILAIALGVSAGVRGFVGEVFIIPSGSMENTLLVGDRVFVSKVSTFHRGDIVVFQDPGDWLSETPQPVTGARKALQVVGVLPNTSTNFLIKRVIGLPGDHVTCCTREGRMSVNGVALHEEAYLYSEGGVQVAPAAVKFSVVVPAGRIFVMGDHRNASGDSRCHLADISTDGQVEGMNAFVPEADIVGPAVAIISPLNRITRLTVPSTFADIPASSGSPPTEPTITPRGVGC